MNNLRILITGGAGFIGSNIAEYLVKNQVFVRVLDNLITGKMDNIKDLQSYPNFEFMYGDVSNLETCRKAVSGINIICHQAALGSVPRSVEDPLMTHNCNVNGFFNMLLAAKEIGIKRFVFASSSSVYGDDLHLPKVENQIGKQLSPYAASKHIDEIYASVFSKTYDMECIGLRYFNVFGPKQDPNGVYAAVIPKFISLMRNNKQVTINGDGSYSRDFTYIDNVIQANFLAMTTTNSQCFGQIFNIGSNSNITILDLFNKIQHILQSNIIPEFKEVRKGDVPYSFANIEKAKEYLGYTPSIDFNTGLERLIKNYL